jgi:hypothetical protein
VTVTAFFPTLRAILQIQTGQDPIVQSPERTVYSGLLQQFAKVTLTR